MTISTVVHQIGWRALVAILLLGSVVSPLLLPKPAAAQAPDYAQQLADKYAPILMLKQQAEDCDYEGEGYFPTTVDWLWTTRTSS